MKGAQENSMSNSEHVSKEESPKVNPQNLIIIAVVAVVLLVAGFFGFKFMMSSFENYKLTVVDGPSQTDTGSISTFTWRVDGPPTTIKHTSVYMGLESNPGELGKNVKPADTKYTKYVTDFADGEFNVPLQFIGNILLDKPGTYYYRLHAIIKDKHYWSDERTFEVKLGVHKVTMVSSQKEWVGGGTSTYTWRVEGPPAKIKYTTVYFGASTTPGQLGNETAPAATTYKDYIKEFWGGEYNIPLQFVGNMKIATPGAYYYRGYALIDGKHFWSPEDKIDITEPPKTVRETTE